MKATTNIKKFQSEIRKYYKHHKRDLPWRRTKNPYRILVSEIMLQQTQVSRVLLKYPEFIKRFPNFRMLAGASTREVLIAWQGLGYNRRALALKKTAEIIVKKYRGVLPRDIVSLEKLPGIGRSTAGAVLAFAYGIAEPFIETNIRRVYIHFFFRHKKKVHDKKILELVARTLDRKNPREWYWALMDYGSMLGELPKNPNQKSIHYVKQSRFVGSDRELRGKILKILLSNGLTFIADIRRHTDESPNRVQKAIRTLVRDGLVYQKKSGVVVM